MSNFEVPPKRDVQLKIMVAPEEKAELDEAAEDNDMTTSNLVRKAIKGKKRCQDDLFESLTRSERHREKKA